VLLHGRELLFVLALHGPEREIAVAFHGALLPLQ
jgi:hypothetical protein